MPEPPDFDQIAQRLLVNIEPDTRDAVEIAEALRQVWNARGAADLAALDPIIGKLGDCMDPDNARDFVTETIRSVDR